MTLSELRTERRVFDFDLYRARVYVRAHNIHLKGKSTAVDTVVYRGIALSVKETLDDAHLRLDGMTRQRVTTHLHENAAGWVAEYRKLMSTN